MIKTQKNKKIWLSVLLAAFCLFFAAATLLFGGNKRAKAADIGELFPALQQTYAINTQFSVPLAKLENEGQSEYADSSAIVFPDGRTYDGENPVLLNTYGKYVIYYYATIAGEKVVAETSFYVKDSTYATTSSASTVTYVSSLDTATEQSGVHITLKEGDTFTYNDVIDLGNADKNVDVIRLFPYNMTHALGSDGTMNEVRYIVVKLTDCFDPSNYIEYYIHYRANGKNGRYPYYLGGASNQLKIGLSQDDTSEENSTRKAVYIDGVRYLARTQGLAGYGTTASKPPFDNVGVCFSFNPVTMEMSVSDGRETRLINSLKNVDIYDDAVLFKGFTTGEVYLSIRGEEYFTDEMNLDVSMLAGKTGEALQNAELLDSVAPVISVNSGDADVANLKAAVGEPFPIFEATASDVNLYLGVKTAVFYNYGTASQRQVGIFNGCFVPYAVGKYTVVYTAQDYAGNVGVETVEVNCLKIAGDKSISFAVDTVSSVNAGEITVLPKHTATGLNGDVTVEIQAVGENDVQTIDENTREFCPMEIGAYDVVYTYYDSVRRYEFRYSVSAVSAGGIAAEGQFILPEYFMKGVAYDMPKIPVYQFADGKKTEVAAELYMLADGATEKKIAFDEFLIEAEERVSFRVTYGGVTYAQSQEIPVVNVGRDGSLDFTKYVAGNFTNSMLNNSILCETNVTSGDSTATFINPLSLSNFEFSFSVAKDWANYDVLSIRLVDYYDRDNEIVLDIYNEQTTVLLSANGGAKYRVGSNFYGKIFTVKYSDGTFDVSSTSAAKSVTQTKQLSSDKILLKVTLKNVSGRSGFEVRQVGNQTFSKSLKMDRNAPVLYKKSSGGTYALDTTVTVYAAENYVDVLSPVLKKNVKMEVYAPSGEYAVATDGTVLNGEQAIDKDYQLRLSEYGSYAVFYTAVDEFGNGADAPDSYVILVEDMTPPTITLADGYSEKTVVKVKLHAKVKVVGYTATDDAGGAVKAYVATVSPLGELSLVEGDTFVADVKGEWKVYYYAYDAVGNGAVAYYNVIVG